MQGPLPNLLLLFAVLHCVRTSLAADLPPIVDWKEVAIPPETKRGEYMVWSYAANYSPHNWRVFLKDGQPHAMLDREFKASRERPSFKPSTKRYSSLAASIRVDDGWLVGFNEGEWGGALYWFSEDGKKNYKISDHQINDLFLLQNQVHAIEGVTHGISEGSLITVTKLKGKSRWQAKPVLKLPEEPRAVSILRDGRVLITLSHLLVSVAPDYSVTTLVSKGAWSELYAYNSIVSPDERKLYIGMRQYVGELDLTTKNLRLLIPSDSVLNKLPQKDEDQIRKVYDGE